MGTDTGPDWFDSAACISSDGFSIATLGNCNGSGKGSIAAIGGLGISGSPGAGVKFQPLSPCFYT